jgi:hypothetical protein
MFIILQSSASFQHFNKSESIKVLLCVRKLRNYLRNFLGKFSELLFTYYSQKANPSRFRCLLTESLSQILCECTEDILSTDEASVGNKDYVQSEHVLQVSNIDSGENEHVSNVPIHTTWFCLQKTLICMQQ